MKILVLGVTGMLGNEVFRVFNNDPLYQVWGTLRSKDSLHHFPKSAHRNLLPEINVLSNDALVNVLNKVRPDIVINCIGLIKQLAQVNDPLTVLPINSLFPHHLSNLCSLVGSRLIHISTDCVFSGSKGNYLESDSSDAEDLYGKSKFIGELREPNNVVTLRTSIIGHELGSNYALIDWFLSQKDTVNGFSRAFFSGLPTVELARVIKDFVLPHPEINGLYHVASEPISKLELLRLVADVYNFSIKINPDESVLIDRSLNGQKFLEATGYVAPAWPFLINKMYMSKVDK